MLADDGARHVVLSTGSTLYLGAIPPDAEPDGDPSSSADGDNNTGLNDEDGVTLPSSIFPNQIYTFTVIASGSGLLNAWIDWNRNGSWNDPGTASFGTNQ